VFKQLLEKQDKGT